MLCALARRFYLWYCFSARPQGTAAKAASDSLPLFPMTDTYQLFSTSMPRRETRGEATSLKCRIVVIPLRR
ncbi:hypothetical protein F5Y18DRAFT_383084 [Xylariaceae sp. FL1019]|nr:hypothetical protein F5Y18DRAFT_383084 [Xylariaceae sp. FL1019]